MYRCCVHRESATVLPFGYGISTNPTQPAIPESTRALFASVCLSSRSMPSLVPLLRSWEDHLWARTSMLVDERISSSLEALGGFWENGMKVGKGGAGGTVVKGEDEWSNEVARTIDELAEVRVDEGCVVLSVFISSSPDLMHASVRTPRIRSTTPNCA